jgi:hypothetical protein
VNRVGLLENTHEKGRNESWYCILHHIRKDAGKLLVVQSVAMEADVVAVHKFDQFGQTSLMMRTDLRWLNPVKRESMILPVVYSKMMEHKATCKLKQQAGTAVITY